MAVNKKLLGFPKSPDAPVTSGVVDFFGDSTGRALYTFDRDNSEAGGKENYAEVNIENGLDGKIGWGMYMDGTNLSGGSGGSYLDTTSDFVPTTGSFTISFWHKPISNFGYLISRGYVSDPLGGFAIWIYTDGSYDGYHYYSMMRAVGSNSSSTAYAQAKFSDSFVVGSGNSNWYHAVFSYNSSNNTVMIMRNGAVGTTNYLRASDNATGIYSQMNSGTLVFGLYGSYDHPGVQRIGNRSNSNSGSTLSNNPYTGFINQLRIFNKAVTSTEGTALSNETIGTWTGTTNTHLFSCTVNYNFDNDAKESMGASSYDGTETNITYGLGKFGAAAVFNGTSAYIDTNATLIPTGATDDFSVSFWLKPNNQFGTILARGNVSTLGLAYGFRIAYSNTNGHIRCDRLTGGAVANEIQARTPDSVIKKFIWNHILLVYDASANTIAYYINGSAVTTSYVNQNGASVSGPMASGAIAFHGSYDGGVYRIGRRNNNLSTSYINGSIDQMRIWHSALTASQAASVYAEKYTYITKNADQPFGDNSCKAYYKFENSSSDSIGSFNATNTNVTYLTNNVPFGTYSGSFAANAYYDLGSSFDDQFRTAAAFGVSVWYQHQAQTNYYGGKILSLLDNIYLLIQVNTNNTMYGRVGQSDGSTFPEITSSALEANLWYHIVFTGDSTGIALYLNGNLVGTSSWDGTFLSYTNTNYKYNYIGYQGGGVAYLKGRLDQMRFFNRKLTGTEAVQLHEELIYG